jgi:hypothetical protein
MNSGKNLTRCLGLAFFLIPVAAGTDAAVLQSIEGAFVPGRAQVTLQFSERVRFTSGRLQNPERIYLDLRQVVASPEIPLPEIPANDALVEGIRIGRYNADVLRLVIYLKLPAELSVVQPHPGTRMILIVQPEHPAPARLGISAVPAGAPQPYPLPAPALHSEVAARPGFAEFGLQAPLAEPAPRAAPVPAPAIAPAKPSAPPAEVDSSRKVTILRVSNPPKLDQFLDGAAPAVGAPVTGFRQREPGDGTPVSQPTTAYLSYDHKNLYVVFVCKDDPLKVRAHLAKREDISNDDQVAIYLDTFRDRQHAYVFAANPLGIQLDGIFTEGQSDPDYSFDTLWYSEGQLTADGYVVWMSIPFKSMRFSNDPMQVWGVALARSIVRNGENSYWPYITRRIQGTLQQGARMDGLEEISPGRNVQLIPYGALTGDRLLNSNQPPLVTQNDARVGMDAKAVLGNALTLDVTLNPDFSQVESDDPLVTINQRYEVVFPEKRPFFLENASYFQTPINLFFSRRIIDPEFGARLTGKLGQWDLGMLASDDRAPGAAAPSSDPLHRSRAADGVFSLRREFGNQSSVGVLATTQDFGSRSNRVFSADTRLRLSPTWFFSGQVVHSLDRLPGGRGTHGSAYYADLLHKSRHFTYEGTYSDFTPDFNATLGYIKRVDIRRNDQYVGYYWRPEGHRILDFGPFASASVDWDHKGVLQDWKGSTGFSMDFKGPSGFTVYRAQIFERYLNQGFHYDKNDFSFYAGWLRWLSVSFGLRRD